MRISFRGAKKKLEKNWICTFRAYLKISVDQKQNWTYGSKSSLDLWPGKFKKMMTSNIAN